MDNNVYNLSHSLYENLNSAHSRILSGTDIKRHSLQKESSRDVRLLFGERVT